MSEKMPDIDGFEKNARRSLFSKLKISYVEDCAIIPSTNDMALLRKCILGPIDLAQPAPASEDVIQGAIDRIKNRLNECPYTMIGNGVYQSECDIETIKEVIKSNGWQSMETAPKDGTEVSLWTGKAEFPSRREGSWRVPTDSEYWVSGSDEPDGEDTFGTDAGWFSSDGYASRLQGTYEPTHWMPLPQPPKDIDPAGEGV